MARYWALLEFVRSAEIVKIFLSYCRGCHSRYGFIALNALDRSHSRVEIRRATGSRTEVVELLRRGVCTVAEIAGRLHLTRNAVRFHLASLRRAGLVRTTGTRPGKRRAHATYELTEQADQRFPNAYKLSLQQLLAELKHRYSRRIFTAIVRSAGDRLANRRCASRASPHCEAARAKREDSSKQLAVPSPLNPITEHSCFMERAVHSRQSWRITRKFARWSSTSWLDQPAPQSSSNAIMVPIRAAAFKSGTRPRVELAQVSGDGVNKKGRALRLDPSLSMSSFSLAFAR